MSVPSEPKSHDTKKVVGHALAAVSALMSMLTALWEGYLWYESTRLGAAGKMNEGDSEGCMVGLLLVSSIVAMPISILVAVILALIALALKARLSAAVALFFAIVAIAVYIGMFRVMQ